LKVPVPIDLIVVIIATVVSHFGNLRHNFEVKVHCSLSYSFICSIPFAMACLQNRFDAPADFMAMFICSAVMMMIMLCIFLVLEHTQKLMEFVFPFQSDSIRAMIIVWRLGGKIILTVLCCVVYDSCAQGQVNSYICMLV